ncbi:hypothetical protein [Flavobacterium filum]|uniref:hypothetical protein n=1 Tax=Flavobacterium TaxID=237 RepID=UPI0023F06334|nr:hypothetical protein [Flavobacterium filum]
MKYLFILLLILSISCQKKEIEPPLFCENELQLFKTFDSLPKTNFSLVDFRDDYKTKLDSLFRNSDSGYADIILNLELSKEEKIPLAFHSYNTIFDEYPPHISLRNFCQIYLSDKDSIYVENERKSLNQVGQSIEDFYLERGKDNFHKIIIAFFWDKKINKSLLTELILETIKGYNGFLNKQAYKNYGKLVCDLSKEELVLLSEEIPFHIRTDFYVDNEGNLMDLDFSPYSKYLPPPPPPMEETKE